MSRKNSFDSRDYFVLNGHCSDVTWVDFNCDKLLASSSNDKTIRIWKEKDGKYSENKETPLKSPLIGHKYGVNCVRFSPDGNLMASVSTDGYLYLWNCQTGQQVLRMPHHTSRPIRVCSFSPLSEFLATAGDDEKLCIWNTNTKSLHKTLTGHEAMITSCVFSPDSCYILSGSTAGDLRMWDAKCGHTKCLAIEPEAHDLGVLSCDFNPRHQINSSDGSLERSYLLASCGNDEYVKLWTIKGECYRCSITLSSSLSGHFGNVYSCKFSQSGLMLASAGYDKSIIIWLVETRAMLHRLDGHTRFVTSVAFSNDDSLLASGSNDKTVIVWNLEKCLKDKNNYSQMKNTQEDSFSRVVNDVNKDPNRTTNTISKWTIEQVGGWLENVGLEVYKPIFAENKVDGVELLHLSHDSLLNVLKITAFGDRNKILRGIQVLRNPLWSNLYSNEECSSLMPEELFCPITHEMMKDPVIASDGYSYEREAITRWLADGNYTSPMTNQVFKDPSLVTNRTLKLLIERYVE